MKNIVKKFILYFIGISFVHLISEWIYTSDIQLSLVDLKESFYFTLIATFIVTLLSYFFEKKNRSSAS